MANTKVQGIQSATAPFIAVEKDGFFQVGDKVRIEEVNSLSHMTVGTLSGLIHRGDDVVPMALVNWLEGAPPVRILMSRLKRIKPVKFWMVCGDVEGNLVREESWDTVRAGTIAPARKFFTQSEALAVAQDLGRRYNRNYILLEATEFTSFEDNHNVGKI